MRTISLRNVLRATTTYTFSTSQLAKVVRTWCVLYILTWKCASCHNGVQFFISHLASWLRTRRFSEPTFRPSGATNHWKNHGVSRLSYLFAHLHLLSSDSFSSTLLSSLLSDPFHLCFSSVHIVGSLTSKFPSNNKYTFDSVDKRVRPISEELDDKRIRLTGHILRSTDTDPLRQVSYKPGSAAPLDIGKRRVGRPRQQWLYQSNALVHSRIRHTEYNGYDFQNEAILQAALRRAF